MTRSTSEVNETIAGHVRQYGWHCLHVFPTKDDGAHVGFTYSIGFVQSYDAPEVVIFGLSREKAHALLNQCAQLFATGDKVEPDVEDGRILARDFKVVFRSIPRAAYDEYLGTAVRYYGDSEFPALLMYLPDKSGLFPWQAGYSGMDASEALSITGVLVA